MYICQKDEQNMSFGFLKNNLKKIFHKYKQKTLADLNSVLGSQWHNTLSAELQWQTNKLMQLAL
jgi:hypothetical protein